MSLRSWVLKRLGGVSAAESQAMIKEAEKRGGFEVYFEAYQANLEAAGESIPVTNGTAMRLSAVYACIRILSETVGSLPLKFYEWLQEGRREAPEYYLHGLLHDAPNPQMSAMEYREVIQNHLAGWGNAFSRKVIDGRGQIRELWPLVPWGIVQDAYRNGVRYYQYQDPMTNRSQWFSEEEIWHLRGLGDDGRWGYNPIHLMRKGIRLGLAAENFGAKFFENDARPGIVIEHPLTLKDEAYKRMKDSWADNHSGAKNHWKPDILEEGAKLHEVGIPPEDAQFLETRKFQVSEIARIFRVPPHMLADLERATWANIENMSLEFVIYSIRPWLVRWEQSIRLQLMLPEERTRFYPQHVIEGLLRGDTKSRYEAYAVGRQNGWLSANDIRELENMNPIDGGGVYLVPLNMVPANQLGQQPEPPADGSPDTARAQGVNLEPVYRDALERIFRRERNEVGEKAKKCLKNGDIEVFRAFLESFYEQHAAFCEAQLAPVLRAGGLNAQGASAEIGKNIAKNSLERLQNALLEPENRAFLTILAGVEGLLDGIEDRAAAMATDLAKGFFTGGEHA